MSAFKGTPGPWKFERVKLRSPGSPTFIEVVAADGPVLPWSAFDRTDRSKRENSHNARLIAAAPELLEACQHALAFVAAWAGVYQHDHGLPDFHPRHKEAIEQVKSAIAKATGGDA